MTDACLYYKACGDDPSDCHKKLLLLDGTFGINSTQSLLFIGMARNHKNKGIPIVFFHFTAWKTSAATHGDYDGLLLQDLLSCWKQAMGRNNAGEYFKIKVVFTDNDTRERNALSAVFPDITKFEDAIAHYNKHLDYFTKLGEQMDTILKKKSQSGLAFLSYFQSYLSLHEFWVAWSPAGVLEASQILHVEPNQVPHTTNHLESFNSQIKHCYFGAYQHSGQLPCIDVWIIILITKVIPAFFQELEVKEAKAEYFHAMQLALSHNHDLSIMIDTSTLTSCDPDESFIPSDAELNAVELFNAWAKMEFIDDICESEAEAEENCDDEDSITSTDPFDWHKTALHADDILMEIPSGLAVNSFDSGESIPSTPPLSFILAGSILGSPSLKPPPLTQPAPAVVSTAHGHFTNQCVTAMQSILALEDSLIQILQHTMTIYDDDDTILQCHISPSIREQLSGNYNPLSITLASRDKENGPSSPAQPSPTKCTWQLPSLPPQKKEKERHLMESIVQYIEIKKNFNHPKTENTEFEINSVAEVTITHCFEWSKNKCATNNLFIAEISH
ncbi:hypothetical protein EDB19DRAFT_1826291 [Suillus lakei]|nr:hypothetical protein EDB19DRAFT_1826291 [Suillus lakei]